MLGKNDCQYRAEKQLIRILDMFTALPYNQIDKYLKAKNPYADFNSKDAIRSLLRERIIYYSKDDKCYKIIQRAKKDFSSICAFAVYNEFSKSPEDKLSKAIYPFDYVFEDNGRLFQLIDYSKNGPYKLNFRRAMQGYDDVTYKIIPIIMLINTGLDVLKERDKDGNYYLLPKDDFYVAFVEYTPGENDIDTVTVRKKKFTGGSI